MDTNQTRIVVTALFFLFIFVTGFWVSRAGKPYPGLRFNVHKLIGLAAGVYLVVTVVQVRRLAPLGPRALAAVAGTALLFVVDVVAGGLVSIEKPMPPALTLVHRVCPYLIAFATAGTLTLLLFPQ
jgi:hypothetical protein